LMALSILYSLSKRGAGYLGKILTLDMCVCYYVKCEDLYVFLCFCFFSILI